MSKEAEVIQHEVKRVVGKRVPPGDRWSPIDNETIVLDSLTDLLEYVFQKKGITQFFMGVQHVYLALHPLMVCIKVGM